MSMIMTINRHNVVAYFNSLQYFEIALMRLPTEPGVTGLDKESEGAL
jgi:hypothetical protein